MEANNVCLSVRTPPAYAASLDVLARVFLRFHFGSELGETDGLLLWDQAKVWEAGHLPVHRSLPGRLHSVFLAVVLSPAIHPPLPPCSGILASRVICPECARSPDAQQVLRWVLPPPTSTVETRVATPENLNPMMNNIYMLQNQPLGKNRIYLRQRNSGFHRSFGNQEENTAGKIIQQAACGLEKKVEKHYVSLSGSLSLKHVSGRFPQRTLTEASCQTASSLLLEALTRSVYLGSFVKNIFNLQYLKKEIIFTVLKMSFKCMYCLLFGDGN